MATVNESPVAAIADASEITRLTARPHRDSRDFEGGV